MLESGIGAKAYPGFLMVDALNPVDSLGIADFAQVSLSRGQISVSENDLTHNLERRTCPGGIGGCMPSQVMGAKIDPHSMASLLDNRSCSCVTNCKDTIS
jgi:hypothetical protein